jgi:hypothetical protein
VYECTSAEEVVDLLAGGQGVFGIAVSGALKELHGSLAHLPAERAEPSARPLRRSRRSRPRPTSSASAAAAGPPRPEPADPPDCFTG